MLNTMAELDERFESFRTDSLTSCAQEWENYKRAFLIHLHAKGLYAAPGRRQVGQLLKHMGKTHIATYDMFTWRDAEPAIVGGPDNGIEARDAIASEDRYNLDDVFTKFDQHFGVHRHRSIKRQEILITVRKSSQSMMSFMAELKCKAEYCDCGLRKDSFICDRVINKINDTRCTEQLMELSDQETLDNVIRICRQVELTRLHVDALGGGSGKTRVHVARNIRGHGRSRGRGYGGSQTQSHRHQNDSNMPYCKSCCRNSYQGQCKASDQFCGACGQRGHLKESPYCSQNRENAGRQGSNGGHGPSGNQQFQRGGRGQQRGGRG